MKTPRNTSLGMLSPSGPPPFPRMNGIMLRSLRHCSDSKEMPPVKVRCNASRRSSTRGKGLPRATRPCKYDGITSELAATTRRRALTMREVTSTSATACLRRAIVVSQMGWRSSSTAHWRPPVISDDKWIGTSLEEKVDDGGGRCITTPSEAGMMNCCVAVPILHVDSDSDAWVLQQACHYIDCPVIVICVQHESGLMFLV